MYRFVLEWVYLDDRVAFGLVPVGLARRLGLVEQLRLVVVVHDYLRGHLLPRRRLDLTSLVLQWRQYYLLRRHFLHTVGLLVAHLLLLLLLLLLLVFRLLVYFDWRRYFGELDGLPGHEDLLELLLLLVLLELDGGVLVELDEANEPDDPDDPGGLPSHARCLADGLDG